MDLLHRLMNRFKTKPDLPPCIYRLRIKRVEGRKTCRVEIRSDQTIGDLDTAIRKSMRYDAWDHCSAFFAGTPWKSRALAEVYPDGSSPSQNLTVAHLGFTHDGPQSHTYLYDFGDNIAHSISVLEMLFSDSSLDSQTVDFPLNLRHLNSTQIKDA